MECCVQFWASKGDMDVLDRVQLRAIMMTKSLENLCYEEMLSNLGLLNLNETCGDLISVYKYLKGGYKEDEASFFSRSRGRGQKLKHRRIHLNIRKRLFTVQMTEH